MSRKTSIFCDRCGVEIPSFQAKEKSAMIKLWAPGDLRASGGQRIDLCETCYQKLVNFLESEVETEPEDDVIADYIKEEYSHCHCGQALDWGDTE